MAKRQNGRLGSVRPSNPPSMATSATAVATAKGGTPQIRTRLTHQQIAERAYYIWLRKGRPIGQDLQNWREAEADLLGQMRA